MSGNEAIWEKEWSSDKMDTVPSHGSSSPSNEIVRFREYLAEVGLIPPKKVIDIGCGKGRNSVYMLKEGFEVTGVDYIQNAVTAAQQLAEVENVAQHASFQIMDVAKPWPFAEGSFDIAIDSLTTVNLRRTEREVCRDEMLRTLTPGGLALIRVVSSEDELEQELMRVSPGEEPNSSIWPETGKFQKNFSEAELRDFYRSAEIVRMDRLTKKAFKIDREFTATNWWVILKKHG